MVILQIFAQTEHSKREQNGKFWGETCGFREIFGNLLQWRRLRNIPFLGKGMGKSGMRLESRHVLGDVHSLPDRLYSGAWPFFRDCAPFGNGSVPIPRLSQLSSVPPECQGHTPPMPAPERVQGLGNLLERWENPRVEGGHKVPFIPSQLRFPAKQGCKWKQPFLREYRSSSHPEQLPPAAGKENNSGYSEDPCEGTARIPCQPHFHG